MVTSDWRAAAAAVLAAAAEEPDPHYRLRNPLTVALWLARLGVDEDEALGHADDARSMAAAARCVACGRDVEVGVAEIFARFGRLADARDALARWDAVGRPSWVEAEWLRRRAGVLVERAADPDGVDVEAALTRLRDEADGQGLEFNALWTELDMGRVLAVTERAAAVAAYRRAADRADAAGARVVKLLADQGLRALGERPWRRGRSTADADGLHRLSAREQEVARLVAEGATNAEIATRLFLSRKTVEHHVSNALAKIRLHSRVELAAEVGRTDGAPPP
jgi:DNA-binding CsgD family transcriptional regulator